MNSAKDRMERRRREGRCIGCGSRDNVNWRGYCVDCRAEAQLDRQRAALEDRYCEARNGDANDRDEEDDNGDE